MRTMIAGALLCLTGCTNNTEPSQVCTLIGCDDGLGVQVTHTLQHSFRVNVRAGTQTIHTFLCDPGQPCQAFIRDQTPEDVTVVVNTSDATSVSKSFRPDYRVSRPNGPNCPPACRQATVTVTVS